MYYLYKGLLIDVHERNRPDHVFSDGYDYAQTAILFLWEHRGKKLGDYYGTNTKGRQINILYACYNLINKELYKRKVENRRYLNLEDKSNKDLQIIQTEEKEDKTELIMEKMNLTKKERETLDCCMSGMGYYETARYLNVKYLTIYFRKQTLKTKYLNTISQIR